MKSIKLMILGLTLVLAIGSSRAEASAALEVGAVAAKFRVLSSEDDTKRTELIEEATKSVAKLAPSADKKLDREQIQQLIELLNSMHKHDAFQRVIDENYRIFEVNMKSIEAELKKLSKEEANEIRMDIYSVIEGGRDTSVAPKPKPKKK